jgi:beta-glucosidase-like glycosyl hydrolase
MTLGATGDETAIYQTGLEVGKQLKALGVHISFAPVADVNSNPKNPIIGMRSFGADKDKVAKHATAYMKGLQDAGIIACAKHFPGHGDSPVDSHNELPLLSHSKEKLVQNELYPFQGLIDAGVSSVMTAHLEVPALESQAGLPSSLSNAIVTDLLQKKMGFTGLIFTDALGMKGVCNKFQPGDLELKALQAGNDVLVCPLDAKEAIDRIEKAVLAGEISEDEIDKKVRKLLTFKQATIANNSRWPIDDTHAKQLRKQLYKQAITIVKPCESFSEDHTLVICTAPELETFADAVKNNSSFTVVSENMQGAGFWPFDYIKRRYNPRSAKHVIIAVSSSADIKTLEKRIEEYQNRGISVSLIYFCSPYTFPLTTKADGLILAYEIEEDAQISAAELICGRYTASGTLPTVTR